MDHEDQTEGIHGQMTFLAFAGPDNVRQRWKGLGKLLVIAIRKRVFDNGPRQGIPFDILFANAIENTVGHLKSLPKRLATITGRRR